MVEYTRIHVTGNDDGYMDNDVTDHAEAQAIYAAIVAGGVWSQRSFGDLGFEY